MNDMANQPNHKGELAPWILLEASPIHGTGAFAARRIPKGTQIIEYRGDRIGKNESVRRCQQGNEFIFSLNDERDLDGSVDWNPARFLNHACSPNAHAEQHGGRIWIIASRDIPAGEEITFNYGYDLENYRDHPCRCGSPECVGFIVAEEFFDHVRAQNALRTEHPG